MPFEQGKKKSILAYISEHFGHNVAKAVYQKIEKVLADLKEMPEAYPASIKQKGLRKCVLSKQTSIYYRVQAEYLEVVSFRANQKDPIKFKL